MNVPDKNGIENESTSGLTRRNFLKVGSACVFAATMNHSVSAKALEASSLNAGSFPVGYWAGSDGLSRENLHATMRGCARLSLPSTPPEPKMIACEDLASGDQNFIQNGVRLSILGMSPNHQPNLGDLATVRIDVLYDEAVYSAWSLSAKPRLRVSSPVSFYVPVANTSGLNLRIHTTRLGETTESVVTKRFVLGAERGEAKLRRGAYLLALTPAVLSDMTGWGRYRFDSNSPTERRALSKKDWVTGQVRPADFAHVVFVVDYATPIQSKETVVAV